MDEWGRRLTESGRVATRRELAGAGFSDVDVKRSVRRGDLTSLRRGWFAFPDADPNVAAAVRAGGVIGCLSALERRGVWVPEGRDRLHIRASVHGRREGDRPFCRPYAALRAPRSAVDPLLPALSCAARCAGPDDFVAICDSALRIRPELAVDDIAEALVGAPAGVRRLLGAVDGRAESGTESLARVRLRRLGLSVTPQAVIADVGRVDLLVGRRLIVEIDSRRHHLGRDYQHDRERDRTALARGYLVVRLSYEDVTAGWDAAVAPILEIVRRRAHR